mgnify:CR=1 FL=1
MRTPLARVCEREDIPNDTKENLMNTLYSINPNGMNERKEAILVKLFRCARRTGAFGRNRAFGRHGQAMSRFLLGSGSSSSKLTRRDKEYAHI